MQQIRTGSTRQRLIDRLQRQAEARASGARPDDALLTTGEVALLFRVSHRAVRSWADTGRLPYIRTLGGHRRFLGSGVYEIFGRSAGEATSEPVASAAV